MGTADQYNPDRAAEIGREQWKRAEEALTSSSAQDLLLDLATLVDGWDVDTQASSTGPRVLMTGPKVTRPLGYYPEGEPVRTEVEDRSILFIEVPVIYPNFFHIGTYSTGIVRTSEGGQVSETPTSSYGSVFNLPNHEQRLLPTAVNMRLRDIGYKPSQDKIPELNAVIDKYRQQASQNMPR